MKVRHEGVDIDKIPDQVRVSTMKRNKIDKTTSGPIIRTAFFLTYGDISIVAEAKFKTKLRHLIFQIGKQKVVTKGKKIDN